MASSVERDTALSWNSTLISRPDRPPCWTSGCSPKCILYRPRLWQELERSITSSMGQLTVEILMQPPWAEPWNTTGRKLTVAILLKGNTSNRESPSAIPRNYAWVGAVGSVTRGRIGNGGKSGWQTMAGFINHRGSQSQPCGEWIM